MAGKRRRSEEALAVNLPAASAVAVAVTSFKTTFAGAFATLRSVAERVHTTLVNLTASTEARRQQIEQQRLHQHAAVDVRAAALQALVCDESTVRTSHLERQLCDIGKAEDALREEQTILESPSNEITQRLALLPSVAVEVDTIDVQLDPTSVFHAISKFGVVFGAQPASMLFDRAFALFVGRDGVQNAAAAFSMFEDAAAQGNATAMGYAAEQLFRGFGVKEDPARAQKMYKEAATKGDLYSRTMVIWLDKRVAKYGDAFSMLWHAASIGHVLATFELGVCFDEGVGCEIDKTASAEWFRRSSDQGYAIAQSQLATCYNNGNGGVEQDNVKAVALYRLAADQGYAKAQFDVGACFRNGEGVTKDPVQAAVWFQRAADQGHAEAQRTLATCLKNGVGVEKNVVQSAVWYRRAAEQGDAEAQNALGLCYSDGKGVDKDPVQAAVWYARAAEQGYAVAQSNLGSRFYFGVGVAKDYTQAVKWLTLAAAQDTSTAHGLLGLCYTTGNGVAKSLVNALLSYQRAADLGNEDAKKDLAKIQAAFPV
jgi:TPR repeat protein